MVEVTSDPDATPAWAVEPVRVVDADPSWPTAAEHYMSEVHDVLGDWLIASVVHIGSTAVPGLAAKPIIDLQTIASDPAAAVADRHDALVAAAWFLVPRELDQRPWRWFLVRADPSGQHRLTHLHLLTRGEPRWQQQLVFRDRLRACPELAKEYAELKTSAATARRHDRESYTRAKQEFICRVLDQQHP